VLRAIHFDVMKPSGPVSGCPAPSPDRFCGSNLADEVVAMPGWLIFLIVLVLVVVLSWRSWRRRGRRRTPEDLGSGTINVGERWRTGGYMEGGGGL
jgi:hypothetical protein